MNPIKWIELAEQAKKGESLICPDCKGKVVAKMERYEDSNGKGFITLNCQSCNKMVHFSNVAIEGGS